MFAPFLVNLGGTYKPDDKSMDAIRTNDIKKSRMARQQLFTPEKQLTLQQRLAALTSEERDKLESVQDSDMITWFNRTKVDERDK